MEHGFQVTANNKIVKDLLVETQLNYVHVTLETFIPVAKMHITEIAK